MVLVSTNTVAKTILLPNPDPGRFLYIVDSTGNANTNNIYVSTNVAGVQICNGYSTIAKAFGAVGYIAYNSNWYAVLNETGTNVWNNVIATNVSTASLSTNYGYFSTISAGTIYGKYVGDGSLLTNLTVAGVTSVLSTQAFYTSSISSANIISQQGYISSLTVDYLAIGYSPGYVAMGDIIATSLSTIAIQSLIVSASNIQAVRMSTGTLTAYGISTNSISSIYSYLSNISTNLLGAVTANITTLNAGTSALAYTTTTGQTNTGSLSNTGTLSNTGLATFGGGIGVTGTSALAYTTTTGQTNTGAFSNTGALSNTGLATFGTGISVTGGISNTTTLSNTGLATFGSGISVTGGISNTTTLSNTGLATFGGGIGVTGTSALAYTTTTGQTNTGAFSNTGALSNTGLATFGGGIGVTGTSALAYTTTTGQTNTGAFSNTGALSNTGLATFGGGIGVTGTSALAYTTTTGQTNTGAFSNTGALSNTGLATFGGGLTVSAGNTSLLSTNVTGLCNAGQLLNTGLATFSAGIGVTGTSALAYTTTTGHTNTGAFSNTGALSNTGLATFGSGISVTGGISNTTTLSNTGLATFAGGIISSNSATANYTGLTVGNGNGWATINSVTGATNYSLLAAAGDTVIRSEGKNLILTSANTANGNASPWPGGICIYGQYTGVNTNTPAYPLDVNGISRSAIPISSICNTTATIGNNGYGIFYYITNSGFNTLIFANAVSPPTPAAGWYISLRNNTGSYLSVSNTGTMTGLVASPFIIPPANTVTLAWDSTPPVSTATFVLF